MPLIQYDRGVFSQVNDTLITDYFHYIQHGTFLDGRPWRDQLVSKLAHFHIIDLSRKIGGKELKDITEIERNFIEWVRE